jgi:ABC-type sugar transport system ATPase subunit
VNPYLFEMRGIIKSYNQVPVLHGVDLAVGPGEVHALVGENGAGKSTLMKILMGMTPRDAGEIRIQDRPVVFRSPKEAMLGGVAMIHQELNPVLDLEVAENVFLGRELRRLALGPLSPIDRGRMRWECAAIFQRFAIDISPTAMMRELSIAQRQLVEIVKAVSLSAKLVVMDEPTSAITEREVAVLFERIKDMRAQGVSIIYISHKMDEIFQISDRISVLRDGAVVASGATASFDRDALIKLMVGREIKNFLPKETVPIGEVVMEVKGLSWGRRIQNVNFSLRAGEILGLAGLVGAGRSETVETLFGMNRASAGEVWVHGRPRTIRSPRAAIRQKIALITEDRKMTGLNLLGTVEENISLAAMGRFATAGFIHHQQEHTFADEYIGRMRIKTLSRETLVSSLSGGNQQKVVLAKWLLTDPDIVIFDEPTRGIDVAAKRDIYVLIGELVRQGKAVLLISSELLELMGLADRILVMAAGRLTGELPREAFSQEKIMELASQFNEVEA